MTAPLILTVWFPFILNLMLQVVDGLLSYQVLSEGVPEGNPLVSIALSDWGVGWGLFYCKTFACVLLQGIHDHSSRVRVRIHCKPECPLAAVHRIKNLVTKEDIIGNVGIVRDA